MLIGEFEAKLTDKNRIAVPSKFRLELGEKMVLSRGYEGCLILLDELRWKNLMKTINVKPILNLNVRDTRRFILGGAHEIELDKQGRFILPGSLKTYSQIEEEIVFIGIEDWVEIWNKRLWFDKLEQLNKSASDIADRLINLDQKHG